MKIKRRIRVQAVGMINSAVIPTAFELKDEEEAESFDDEEEE